MAATYNWGEDNGTATGSPAHGTTRGGIGNTNYPTDVNWKSVDDNTANGGTAYSSAPVLAGNNSFEKWQFGIFTGTFNSIIGGTNAYYAHTAGVFPANTTLKVATTASYTAPTTSATAVTGAADQTTAISITSSGIHPNVGGTGPQSAASSSSTSNPSYTSYLVSQLQTTASAPPGDTASITQTVQYQEN